MRTAIFAGLLAMALSGCSGDVTSRSATGGMAGDGAGGAAGGVALLDDCAQGDTRACLGPGACEGAQTCDAAGLWSVCDCGDEPGAGGVGGYAPGTGGAAVAAGCDPGWLLCDGFCVDPRGDMENCGECGVTCTGDRQVCADGTCGCPDGMVECPGTPDACWDLQNSTEHSFCGDCSIFCTGICVAGACTH